MTRTRPLAMGRHLPHSVTCHPTQVNVLVLDLPTPKGWKAELT